MLPLTCAGKIVAERLIQAVADWIPTTHRGLGSGIKRRLYLLAGLRVEDPVFIDHGFRYIGPSNITIERFVSLGHDNYFWAFTPVRIGHHTMTAKDLLIISASHDVASFEPMPGQAVDIGPGCWIGARVTILGGVKVGRGCVIGAGSLVRDSIPDFSIAAGVPAKVIRQRQPADMIWSQFGRYPLAELM